MSWRSAVGPAGWPLCFSHDAAATKMSTVSRSRSATTRGPHDVGSRGSSGRGSAHNAACSVASKEVSFTSPSHVAGSAVATPSAHISGASDGWRVGDRRPWRCNRATMPHQVRASSTQDQVIFAPSSHAKRQLSRTSCSEAGWRAPLACSFPSLHRRLRGTRHNTLDRGPTGEPVRVGRKSAHAHATVFQQGSSASRSTVAGLLSWVPATAEIPGTARSSEYLPREDPPPATKRRSPSTGTWAIASLALPTSEYERHPNFRCVRRPSE